MEIRSVRTPGLGDATYLIAHRGRAVVIDPQRDVQRFIAVARELGTSIRQVLETHVHNDYVSGGRALAAETGAQLVLPAGAGVAFAHTPAFHQEDLAGEDGLTIRPIHTPGHTPEHLSYLVLIDGVQVALFSGGSLLVGAVGRCDLLGASLARELTRSQYGSAHRLGQLPDEVGLFPTHGEGSFCAAGGANSTTSTIGLEKRQNPAFTHPNVDAFVEAQLAALQPYPAYYAQMGPINRLGPSPLPHRVIPGLTPGAFAELGPAVRVIDARPRASFAAGHLPGALGVELAEEFGTWVGWLLPFDAPLAIVLEPDQDIDEAVVQLGRIGFDHVRAVLRDMPGWQAEGRPVSSYRTVDVATFAEMTSGGGGGQVLDVRSPAEWDAGHLPDAVHRYVPDLAAAVPADLSADRPVLVACGSGYRATIAAGLLERAGLLPIVLEQGGVPDVIAAVAERRSSPEQ